jgi:hypothetical protein
MKSVITQGLMGILVIEAFLVASQYLDLIELCHLLKE